MYCDVLIECIVGLYTLQVNPHEAIRWAHHKSLLIFTLELNLHEVRRSAVFYY